MEFRRVLFRSAGARDALDTVADLDPTAVEYVDSRYFEAAGLAGKTFRFYDEAKEQFGSAEAVLVVTLNDFNERSRTPKMKKLQSTLTLPRAHVERKNHGSGKR